MPALSINVPFPVFQDRDGQPLENGYVYIGTPYLDPQTNPVQVYFDDALTIPAAQPLRTINGYVSNSGTPAQLYVNGVNFSIKVLDSKANLVYSFPDGNGVSPNASGITFTGFKGQVGFVSDIAGDDGADWIGFQQDGTGVVARSSQDKMRDIVSVKDFGAVGDGIADDTTAINAAIAASNAIFFPAGTYKISSTIGYWGANPIGKTLYGASTESTEIIASSTMTGQPMIRLGNSSGYGAQYCNVNNITINGYNKSNNNTGLLYLSAGLSQVDRLTIKNCGLGAWMHGCIDTAMTNCIIASCTSGATWDVYPIGVPSSPTDTSVQATQTTRANISRMVGCWITDCVQTSVYISGGNFLLDSCTFQSSTNNAAYNIIWIKDSNESFDYGGGPIIQNCWQEGGTYKYIIYVENTRQTRIFNNHLNGDFGAGTNVEGAIFLDALSVKNVSIKNNSIRGNFAAPPTGGRLANASIYVTNSTYTYTADIENNYITTNTTNVYWAGLTSPTVDRRMFAMFANVTISAGVATVNFQSMNFISSITKNGTGDFTVIYNFNRQTIASGFYPVSITPSTLGGGITYSVSHLASTTQADRFIFNDKTGAAADPSGFSISLLGGGWVQI